MTPETARALAERVHGAALDRYGSPLVQHVARVAAAVPVEAAAVAWLHEALEYAGVTEDELRRAGASGAEIGALKLLTRNLEGDDAAYLAHIARIARAPGRSGRLARIVKRVDLADRTTHKPSGPEAPAIPPYAQALEILREERGDDRVAEAASAQRDELNKRRNKRNTLKMSRKMPAASGIASSRPARRKRLKSMTV
jgi:hypothetical protein